MSDFSLADAPYLTLVELGRAYRDGSLSPVEVTEHLLERIDTYDGKLHAFIEPTRERALAEAAAAEAAFKAGLERGPLHGIPYAVKDLYDVKGLATTAGTHLLEDNIAGADCAAVERLAAAGMVLLGKTHTVQFALGIIGVNHDHGTPHNPWHETPHVPGGSSSGSAVAVASGLTPMALGSDTGGSVRAPAALCGTVGLKTTVGRIGRHGVFPLCWTLDSVGPLTRSVEDAALVYDALQGEDLRDESTRGVAPHDVLRTLRGGVKGLRIAIGEGSFFDDADPEVEAAVREAGKVFGALGARVESIGIPEVERANNTPELRAIILAEAVTLNQRLIEEHADQLDPVVLQPLKTGQGLTAVQYATGLRAARQLQADVLDTLRDVDAVLVPTTRIPARPLAQVDASIESYFEHYPGYLNNTLVGNYLNLCGVALPCGFTKGGLPIGLLVYAKPFQEDVALRVARAYEQATDWLTRRPDLSWAR
ncbi:MAG: amidase [SAR324 cluster bacterium]|nr:amidase [SAR324 cluster bacterium]MCH8888722.1 amidase [SAR324 cluster bacterium]